MFRDKTLVWSADRTHKRILKDLISDATAVATFKVLTQCPEPSKTALMIEAENTPDATSFVDSLVGYFQRSFDESPDVVLDILHANPTIQNFKGTFQEYFESQRS